MAGSRADKTNLHTVLLVSILIVALLILGWVSTPLIRGSVMPLVLLLASVVCFALTRDKNIPGWDRQLTRVSDTTQGNAKLDLNKLDWYQFEKLIAVLYEQHGFTVKRSGGAKPDGGIDLTISKDGQPQAVQCKHWKSWKIGVKQMREFRGALHDAGLQSGIFVSMQEYTTEAKDYALRNGIELKGAQEVTLMLEALNWGRNAAVSAILKDGSKICPRCECEMVERTATKGKYAGQRFYGCSAYPKCNYTMPWR